MAIEQTLQIIPGAALSAELCKQYGIAIGSTWAPSGVTASPLPVMSSQAVQIVRTYVQEQIYVSWTVEESDGFNWCLHSSVIG
jgi:hypothetical protein